MTVRLFQQVDHFSFTNNDTFRMKYLINDSYWEPKNGPIFFYAGNEGAIEMFCENTVSSLLVIQLDIFWL